MRRNISRKVTPLWTPEFGWNEVTTQEEQTASLRVNESHSTSTRFQWTAATASLKTTTYIINDNLETGIATHSHRPAAAITVPVSILWIFWRRSQVFVFTIDRWEETAIVEILQNQLFDALPKKRTQKDKTKGNWVISTARIYTSCLIWVFQGAEASCVRPVSTPVIYKAFCKRTAVGELLRFLFSKPQSYQFLQNVAFQQKHITLHRKPVPQMQAFL